MAKRFVIYGLLGWILEIFWTGMGSLLKGNLMLSSFTYLWMFPIYGSAVLLEPIHNNIEGLPWYIRGMIWVVIILSIEYITGWVLMSSLGSCPWDYSEATPYHIQGLIRLDYIPAWFLAGLIFERIHRSLDKLVI